MKEFWITIQFIFSMMGGWLGYFIGGCDGLFITLIVFVILDYITGVIKAIIKKKLNSEIGYKGLIKKITIFLIVGIANLIDINILGSIGVLRTAIIFFYLSNEGLSITENASQIGLPIPEKLKDVLEQLHTKSEEKGEVKNEQKR